MEDCCAVCAEPLEWVAYGPCGHNEVCFTCTARMRFVLNDKRCCICKQDCPNVYVTKALGDYTKVVTDFNRLQEQLHSKEKGGDHLWFENNVQAYFDDEEPFRLVKAMCRLYCSVCELATPAETDDTAHKGTVKKGHIFKSIESLRRHLFSAHRLIMCELCLEGRKVFICEQNLFARVQLDRHSDKGDSEVDGTEEERGGFTGHPMCEFCRRRFYGENELYQHMSTEHYTCHLCQRSRPGHFEYYRNYDALEMHFRDKHSLCEHSDCLNKKFVVFTSEAELKRHNAQTHGGNMSRSQRNAALQLPVIFQFRRPGQENPSERPVYGRAARGRHRHAANANGGGDSVDEAVQASVEQAILEDVVRESAAMSASMDSVAGRPSTSVGTPEGSNSFAALDSARDGEAGPSRYSSAVSGSGPSSLIDSAFPPLPGLTKKGKHKQKNRNTPATMATLLGGGGSGRIRILNVSDSRPPSAGPTPGPSSANGDARPGGWVTSNSLRPSSANGESRAGGWANSSISSTKRAPVVSVARSDGEGQLQRLNAVSGPGPPPSASDGVPDSVNESMGLRVMPPSGNLGQSPTEESVDQLSMEEIRAANKALIERIQIGLEGNERQFADFKDVSTRFRKGEMNAQDYNGHITRLGISYVVPELARLLPDPSKRTELLGAHRAGLARDEDFPPVSSVTSSRSESPRNPAETGKAKGEREGSSQSGSTSNHSSTCIISQPINGEVDILSTDGYRRAKGKVKVDQSSSITSVVENPATEVLVTHHDPSPKVLVKANRSLLERAENSAGGSVTGAGWTCDICTLVNQAGTSRCAACGIASPSGESLSRLEKEVDSAGIDKRKKKLSKFQRVRLGDGSAAALLDSVNPNPWAPIIPTTPEIGSPAPNVSTGRSFGRGAWNNGGGQRLVSMSQREAVIDSAWGRK